MASPVGWTLSCKFLSIFWSKKPWIRIGPGSVFSKMLGPDRGSMNPDQKHWPKPTYLNYSHLLIDFNGTVPYATIFIQYHSFIFILCLIFLQLGYLRIFKIKYCFFHFLRLFTRVPGPDPMDP
jgi:hypothetical protein